jgi:hypothetical protein
LLLFIRNSVLAIKTLRAHSETPTDFAAFSIAFSSEGLTRARTISLFASPFGSFGRPILEDFIFVAQKVVDVWCEAHVIIVAQ